MNYICPNCGNQDPRYIAFRNGKPYCRRCISFIGSEVEDDGKISPECDYHLNYELTEDQKRLSGQLLENFLSHQNSLVYAVCGAGKTEIVLEVIRYAINTHLHVGFAVPRKDVVIELTERFQSIYTQNKVTAVYGGHTATLNGDFVILTSHQLYRYPSYFDLLIMDEIDAFPFKDNFVLHAFFIKACRGNHILMSATPTDDLLKEYQKDGSHLLELYTRFHLHPLPVPKISKKRGIAKYFSLIFYLKKYQKEGKQVFVFTPTIERCETVYLFTSLFVTGGSYVHSKKETRAETIQDFRNHKYFYLVTTAVLERGVTVKNLQVIIFGADHALYDRYALIQIAGRAGRKKEAPEGEVIFLVDEENEEIRECIRKINDANAHLPKMPA